jgi:hypothetical protein
MRYTYKSITSMWLLILVLFALSASGSVTGRQVLLLAAAAFGAPLLLTSRASKQVLNEEGAHLKITSTKPTAS